MVDLYSNVMKFVKFSSIVSSSNFSNILMILIVGDRPTLRAEFCIIFYVRNYNEIVRYLRS